MAHPADVARGRNIVARWCNLAEQRLEHLTELFETGRWRRFHSEVQFLQNIQEAKAAVETWRNLLNREAALDLRTALDNEAELQAICMQGRNFTEAHRAFFEKREPEWTGR